jgi:hypothetical protein
VQLKELHGRKDANIADTARQLIVVQVCGMKRT